MKKISVGLIISALLLSASVVRADIGSLHLYQRFAHDDSRDDRRVRSKNRHEFVPVKRRSRAQDIANGVHLGLAKHTDNKHTDKERSSIRGRRLTSKNTGED